MREMKREEKKIKIYYLFFINISIKDNNNLLSIFNNGGKVEFKNEKNDTSIISDSNNSIHRNEIEKIINTSTKQKILFSNKLAYYILKRYFGIKLESQKKQIKDDEFNSLLKDSKKNNSILKNSITPKSKKEFLNLDFTNTNIKELLNVFSNVSFCK